jgi:hypothetical protein
LAILKISLDIVIILNKGEIMNNRTIRDIQPKRVVNRKIDEALENVMAMIILSRETKQPLSDIALAIAEKSNDITNIKIKN